MKVQNFKINYVSINIKELKIVTTNSFEDNKIPSNLNKLIADFNNKLKIVHKLDNDPLKFKIKDSFLLETVTFIEKGLTINKIEEILEDYIGLFNLPYDIQFSIEDRPLDKNIEFWNYRSFQKPDDPRFEGIIEIYSKLYNKSYKFIVFKKEITKNFPYYLFQFLINTSVFYDIRRQVMLLYIVELPIRHITDLENDISNLDRENSNYIKSLYSELFSEYTQ
jgi:hypothetical protein